MTIGPLIWVAAVGSAAMLITTANISAALAAEPAKTAGERALLNGRDLDGWKVPDKYDFANHGKVEVKEGEIHMAAGKPETGIAYQGAVPRMNYEVSWEAKRTEGGDFFCALTFPVEEAYCTMIVGGWGGSVVGLSNLDGFSAVENETTEAFEFTNDRWYAFRLQVTPEAIRATIDGKQVIATATEDHEYEIWWEQEPLRPLGFANWNTGSALRNIKLTSLAPEAKEPSPQKSEATVDTAE